jgi:hypothetical protein
MMITFEHGETYIGTYGSYKHIKAEYTPLYMLKDDKEFLVATIVKPLRGTRWDMVDYDHSVKHAEKIKAQLIETEGKYFCDYGKYDNPFDFLKRVQDAKFTLAHFETQKCYDGHVIFSGNLVEYPAAFCYHVYDPEIINEIQFIVGSVPKKQYGRLAS